MCVIGNIDICSLQCAVLVRIILLGVILLYMFSFFQATKSEDVIRHLKAELASIRDQHSQSVHDVS